MTQPEHNPLLSAHKASDSGLQVQLHPLVLLTISDYVTRHTLRRQQSPIVGALLGQQIGRDVSLEVAFEARVLERDGTVVLDEQWFVDRLQQYKDVYKEPPLELVGWFSLAPTSGPQAHHLPIHRYIQTYNESAVLLTFHPSLVAEEATSGGKLPITIYETVYEAEEQGGAGAPADGDGDKAMQVDGDTPQLKLRLSELPYSIETGEAEMISVDFVARGGGNAMAVDERAADGLASESTAGARSAKGKGKGKETGQVNGKEDIATLNPEDEEMIASLTAKANAVKMLHSRLQLIRTYLTSLPPSYLNSSSTQPADSSQQAEVDHTILRSIQALLNRLPLLIPADNAAFDKEKMAQANDVSLVNLIGSLTSSIKDAKEVGRKFDVVEKARQSLRQATSMGNAMAGGGGGAGGGGTGYGGFIQPETGFLGFGGAADGSDSFASPGVETFGMPSRGGYMDG